MLTLITNNNSNNSKSAAKITNTILNKATTINAETDTVSFIPDFVVANESHGSNFN